MSLPDIRIVHVRTSGRRAGAGGAEVVDVTSGGELPWRRFSPFYPHGGIPVPFWPGRAGESVEGIWQGLKRFEHEDEIDPAAFENRSMKGLKRTSRARGRSGHPRGRVLGHQMGRHDVLLTYLQARVHIYLPAYRWVLENRLRAEVAALRDLAFRKPLVLLDHTTNAEVEDLRRPLSHAALVRAWLLDRWPDVQAELPAVPS